MDSTISTRLDLHPDHQADLRKSGLKDDAIALLQITDARPHDLRRLPAGVMSAYRLPYFSLDGDVAEYSRLRLFPPVMTADSHAMKYYQQQGTDPHAYFPPLLNWREIASTPTRDLFITEGEKKAVAGCQRGYACVGIGGVWAWRVRVEQVGRITLPSLDQFNWTGRDVIMVADSDAWRENKLFDILSGFYALAMDLSQRGATVSFKRLHDRAGLKQGLDDFFLMPGVSLEQVEKIDLMDPFFKRLAAWYQQRPPIRAVTPQAMSVEPISLDTPLLPPLPMDAFPDWFRDMVVAVAQATETPVELAALQGLAVLSACVQRTFIIQPKQGYIEPLSLWTLTALESGNRKSAVMHIMAAPLMEYERQQAEAIKPERTRVQSERELIESRIEGLRSKGARGNLKDFEDTKREIQNLEASLPDLPTIPRLWAQDITPEKIAQVMAENHERIALFSDEGGIFDIMGGRYSSGVANLDIFLQAHSGFSYRVDRGSRLPITMKHPALAIGISPQPSVLRALGDNKVFRGRGLLARFLYAMPTSFLGKRTFSGNPVSPAVSARYAAHIQALLSIHPPYGEDREQGQYTLVPDEEAAHELRDFSLHVETMLGTGGRYEHIQDWAGKLPGAAARIAGVLHCGLHAHGQPWTVPVSLSTMKGVGALAVVLGQHALAAFDLMGCERELEDARRIFRWIEQRRQPMFTEAECFQSLRGHFKKMMHLSPAMKILEERYIVFRGVSRGPGRVGRPSSPLFRVNQKIMGEWQ